MSDLAELGAVAAAARIRKGDLSAEIYAESLLGRTRAFEALNAFISIDIESVREAARAADTARAQGDVLGPLHGVPLAIKDNIDVAGQVTSGGTPALANHRPRGHAPVMRPLLEAGAIVLGKTNLHELAFGTTTNNGAFGPTRNPYDPSRVPGGSSGGTGAAVGARLAPAGLGSDTGGSVRIPAALCGVLGYRPTTGRYPSGGIVPIAHTRDTAGPMARAMEDIVMLDGLMAGGSPSWRRPA